MNKIPISIFFIFATLFNIIIGFIEWKLGYPMPFTIFFVIPPILLAIHKKSSRIVLVLNAFIAASIWFAVYIQINPLWFCLFNGIIRFSILLTISYVIQLLIKQKVITEKQNLELTKLNEEKNRILGIAAHDIRNGISGIFSLSELVLENQNLKTSFHQEFDLIELTHKSSENLLALLSKILDISKIESGIISINLLKYDYVNFIEERVKQMSIVARRKDIQFVTNFEVSTLIIEFDELYLQETIDNLLSNAIKYSYPESEIKVFVYLKDNLVYTEVTDFGVGIPEIELGKIFGTFSKGSSQPTSGEHSAGLGLAIAKKIVELHRGTIGVKSKMNQGSTFFYSLPV
jgi:signal transduction histidine kinase